MKKRKKGFTMIESVVVLILVGMVASMAYMIVTYGVGGFVASGERSLSAQMMDTALRRMSMEIRDCVPPGAAPGLAVDTGELVYATPDGQERRIGIDGNVVYLDDGTARRTLAEGVASFVPGIGYGDLDGDGVPDEVVTVSFDLVDTRGRTWSIGVRPRITHRR